MFYRHIYFGHIVQTSAWPDRGDVFAGTVVEADDERIIDVGTYSTIWIKKAFVKTSRIVPEIDTFESLRIALGVEAEPLATLPQRVQERATRAGRALAMLEAWAQE